MRGGTPNMTAATAAATNTAPNRKNRAGAIRLAIAISDALPDGAAIRLDRRDENRDRLGGGRPVGRIILIERQQRIAFGEIHGKRAARHRIVDCSEPLDAPGDPSAAAQIDRAQVCTPV